VGPPSTTTYSQTERGNLYYLRLEGKLKLQKGPKLRGEEFWRTLARIACTRYNLNARGNYFQTCGISNMKDLFHFKCPKTGVNWNFFGHVKFCICEMIIDWTKIWKSSEALSVDNEERNADRIKNVFICLRQNTGQIILYERWLTNCILSLAKFNFIANDSNKSKCILFAVSL
jgi:hypothetical protein